MSEDIHISVSTPEEAERLRSNFEEVVARVNGDLMSCSMQPNDPISVEAAVAFAEQSIDRNISSFGENAALQSLAPELKQRFRKSIEEQAFAAQQARSAPRAPAKYTDAKIYTATTPAPVQESGIADEATSTSDTRKKSLLRRPVFVILLIIGISILIYGVSNFITDLRCNSGAVCLGNK